MSVLSGALIIFGTILGPIIVIFGGVLLFDVLYDVFNNIRVRKKRF